MHRSWKRATFIVALSLLPATTASADKPGDKPKPATTVSAAAGTEAKVNINSAGVKELTTLAGIGPKVASRIVEYREAHGPFKKPEDVRRVEGVGPGIWERNRERIVTK